MSVREYVSLNIKEIDTKEQTPLTQGTIDSLGENFFLLDEKGASLLESSEVLLEIQRRTEVYRGWLEGSSDIYKAFSSAYEGTPYKLQPPKIEYITGVAQWLLSIVLFGNDEHKRLEAEDVNYIRTRINSLFNEIPSEDWEKTKTKKKIIENITTLLDKWYSQHKIRSVWMLGELQTQRSTLFSMIISLANQGKELDFWRYTKASVESILIDLLLIKRKYSQLIFDIYTGDPDAFYYRSSEPFHKEKFDALLDELIQALPVIGQIKSDETTLWNTIMETIINDTWTTPLNENLSAVISTHVTNHKILASERISYGEEKSQPVEVTAENFWTDEILYNKQINYQLPGGIMYPADYLENIMKEYKRYVTLKSFDALIWTANYEQINKDKETFGAKVAYLKEMDATLPKFQSMRGNVYLPLYVHDFQVPAHEDIPTEQYSYRKEHGALDKKYFKTVFDRRPYTKTWGIIIRSSAVFSEDNDKTTGAGVYHSEPLLKEKYTFKDFCKAIEKVYASCDSEDAKKYREINNIPEEKMGITIQKYVYDTLCQANSVMAGRPELMELQFAVTENKSCRVIVNKERLEEYMFHDSWFETSKKIFHLAIDRDRYGHSRDMESNAINIAQYMYLMERYFWRSIQWEIMIHEDYNEENHRQRTLENLQIRPLPPLFTQWPTQQISFPPDQALNTSFAIWRCDEELTVLPNDDYNGDKRWAVIFKSSHGTSITRNIEGRLPKEGAVIMLASGFDGHIETLCLERWLVCLFPEAKNDSLRMNMDFFNRAYVWMDVRQVNDRHDNFMWYKKIRVIANGLEGRIYPLWEK
jgi:hypothetical protein